MELDHPICEQLLSHVVEGGLQSATDFLDSICQGSDLSKKTKSSLWLRATAYVSGIFSQGDEDNHIVTRVREAVKETAKAARKISDSEFLSDIVKADIVQASELNRLAKEAQEIAISHLGTTISSLVDEIVLSAQRYQEARCIADINTEISNLETAKQHTERLQFIHQVNRGSNQDGHV